MRLDDLRKLATGTVLFTLDRVISPRLVKVLYLLGLGAIIVWAVRHLFANFAFGFGAGLWGMLEIAVFGLLAFVVLRILCEAVIVYFRTHADVSDTPPHRLTGSLLDDVRGAIEELASEEDDEDDEAIPAPGPRAHSAPATPGQTATGRPRADAFDAVAHNRGVQADTAPEFEQPAAEQPGARQPSTAPGASHN